MIYPPLKIISNSGDDILVKYNVNRLELYSMYTIRIYLTNNFNINEDQDSIAICKFVFCVAINNNVIHIYSYLQCSRP